MKGAAVTACLFEDERHSHTSLTHILQPILDRRRLLDVEREKS